jgi:hypothetical protein
LETKEKKMKTLVKKRKICETNQQEAIVQEIINFLPRVLLWIIFQYASLVFVFVFDFFISCFFESSGSVKICFMYYSFIN